jgi:hypothetical protein
VLLLRVQQLAAAKSDAEALKTDRDQLAEVVLEMQVNGSHVATVSGSRLLSWEPIPPFL